MNPIMAAMQRRGLMQQQGPQEQPGAMQMAAGHQGMTPNPQQGPLDMLKHVKGQHATMIIQGLLKHLHKTTPDANKNAV